VIYVNNIIRTIRQNTKATSCILLFLTVTACSTTTTNDDPLQYTRKLVKQGHTSLYDNGAFQVPYTEIKLIPAGESATNLAFEMMGMQARQSFLTSLKNAADSVYIVPTGSKLSLDYAKTVKSTGDQLGESVTDISRPVGTLIIDRSIDTGKNITLKAWDLGKKSAAEIKHYGIAVEKSTESVGDELSSSLTTAGMSTIRSSWSIGKNISEKSTIAAKKSLFYAGDEFIKGYVAVPEKISSRAKDIADASELSNFTSAVVEANTTREQYSHVMTDLITDTAGSYTDDVQQSFKKAGDSFRDSVGVTGFGLALLKSSRWVLQGILWDGLVKPISKLGAGSVGYIAVNLTAFPAMVIVKEGIAVTNLAIEVSWNTLGATYDLVAPSAKAAVASVFSLFEITAGNLAAGTTTAGIATIGAGSVVTGEVSANVVKGVGYISGKSMQYIGVPLTAAGVTLGAGTVGVVAGGAGAVTGSAVVVSGEAVSATSQVFGNLLAGTTLVAGTTASVVAGTGVGVYELSKAIIVPTSYELGGGIVLGYGSASQLAAHSVLAVADASYLVLSLEGPRWVIYAVKGDLGNGDDLPPGTLLDLEAMQNNGEEFYYLPVSDAEMNSVVEQVYKELPTVSENQN